MSEPSPSDLKRDLELWIDGNVLPTQDQWRSWLRAVCGGIPQADVTMTANRTDPLSSVAVWHLHEFGWPVVAMTATAGPPWSVAAVFAFPTMAEAIEGMAKEIVSLLPEFE